MQIDLTTLKRIAKAVPDLTIAAFVAVWSEKIEDQKRERDRERHRKTLDMNGENERKDDGKPQSREEQEKQLFALGRKICGKSAGGMVTTLLKQTNYDISAVTAILTRAEKTDDPKAFVVGNIKRSTNGTGNDLMAAFDDLIGRAGGGAVAGDPEMVDVTPKRP